MRPKLTIIFFICLNMFLCASPQKKFEKARANDPLHQCNMGLFHLNEGNIDEAIKYLNKALSLNPRYDLALNALGLAHSMKGNFTESEKYFQKCLQVNPSMTEAHNYLGTVYQEMGFVDKAEREFRIATLDRNYKSRELPYYNLARLYILKEKLTEALEYINRSLEINDSFRMAYNLKGIILERQLKFDEAVECYKEALKNLGVGTNPEVYVDISFNLGVVYFKNNEFKEAKKIFEKISSYVTDFDMKEKIDKYLRMIK